MKTRREMVIGLTAASLLPASCREKAGKPQSDEVPPTGKGESAPDDADFVGLTETEGAALAKKRALLSRVVSVDGQPRPATRDYRPERVNFEMVQGRIAKVSRG